MNSQKQSEDNHNEPLKSQLIITCRISKKAQEVMQKAAERGDTSGFNLEPWTEEERKNETNRNNKTK